MPHIALAARVAATLLLCALPGLAQAQGSPAKCATDPTFVGCYPVAASPARTNVLYGSAGDASRTFTIDSILNSLLAADVKRALGYVPYDAANPAGYQTAAQIAVAIPAPGTTAGTYAAGDDARITGALQARAAATVAISGSYTDLTNKPTIPPGYTLPPATTSAIGGVKPGLGFAVAADGTLTPALTWAQIPAEAQNTPVPVWHPGTMAASETTLTVVVNQPTLVPANLAGTVFLAGTNPAATVTWTISTYHAGVWTVLGTVSVSPSGVVTLPTSAAVTLVVGDAFRAVGPAAADTALADFSLNFLLLKV